MKVVRRSYVMTARKDAAELTATRLVGAMQELFAERRYDDITLDAVAERAGVTLQTLLRRFGSKAGLLAAAAEDGLARVEQQRSGAVGNDLRGCVKNLFDHYEEWGTISLRLLAEEERIPEIAGITARAREMHAKWVEQAFAGALAGHRSVARQRLHAQLVVCCDVYVWKLLRRDLGHSRAEAERVVLGLLESLMPTQKEG
ncbi:Transcriptional regulator, TetR family [Labilithrix luteola]|uniref:Transcriptional regulator, TetR family n=1 Tax=Labilithrix luteola TaxID=1391654 RepID=A0A0K1PWY1_9BACT|nr:TetR/AcrR family transcriptional regulator [Labilithrix luteola]AKU97644.1 Transcriptional regulator, TetR family [Labilithrix luteola]